VYHDNIKGNAKCIRKFQLKIRKERDTSEDLGMDRRLMLKSYRNRFKRVEWINMAQDGVQWEALVNTAMNLRIP
jgi:hypothetical protein